MGFITADRNEIGSLNILDCIPKDDKCRFIVDVVSQLDLAPLYDCYSSQGGDAYDPAILLGTWFYAYSEGESSSRKVEERCCYDIRYIYVSANLQPDHCALSRFRRRNADLMPEYFAQIVAHIIERGEALGCDFKEINIDGANILAYCSKRHSKTSEKLALKIGKLKERVGEYLSRCEAEDVSGEELEVLGEEKARLEAEIEHLSSCSEQLAQRKETLKAEHREGHQLNTVEPEARMLPKSNAPAYNGIVGVDNNQFILGNHLSDEPNEQQEFSTIHQKVETNLKEDADRQYNTDAGFHSRDQLEYANEQQIDVVMADPNPQHRSIAEQPTAMETLEHSDRKLERSDFSYHEADDYYQCPGGQKLEPLRTYRDGNSTKPIYQSPDCQGCALFERCLTKSQQESKQKVKKIYRDQKEPLAEEMARKLQSEEAKQRLKTRMSTVEPVFGNLKENLGFRKFRLKGLKLVTGEFNLMCIAHNLNALFIKALWTYFYPLYARLWRVSIFSMNKNQNLIELPSWSGCAPQKPREVA
jgi:transposase